jgi:hypothetical protein
MFRARIKPGPGRPIDAIEAAKGDVPDCDSAIADIFETINANRGEAAVKAKAYLEQSGSDELFFATARRMIFHKGRDAHDYKYAAAAWEECQLAGDPKWRAPLAAAMTANLPGAKSPDSPLMIRAREAVAQVFG